MKNTVIYWISTGLISLMMLFSAYAYLTDPEIAAGFTHIGYPGYFRVELAIAKILGTTALLVPVIPRLIKEWAYAGLGITFISAFIAHIVNEDPVPTTLMPLLALTLLIVSRLYLAKKK